MNRYQITLYRPGARSDVIKASGSRMHIAVNKVLRRFTETQLRSHAAAANQSLLTIEVAFLGKQQYEYVVEAFIPCEPKGSRKMAVVSERFATKEEAKVQAGLLQVDHPDWHYVRAERVEARQ